MFKDEEVLLKRGWRGDGIWTNPVMYKSFLKLIPFYFDTRALMRSQYWPRVQIERLQDGLLRTLFKDAVRVPFWKEIFDSAHITDSMTPKEVLARLPITSKKELTEKAREYITDVSLLSRSDPDHTSGSTGKPFHFYQDWHASLRSFAITERIFRTTGRRFPIVYMRARERNGFTFFRHIWFYVRGFNSIQYRIDDLRLLGRRLRSGFILYGYTSWVLELAKQMERLNITLPIRVAMVAGEHLTEPDRAYIERVLGVELFTLYASREVGFLGYECEKHHMHLSEEWAYVEIVDEKGVPLPTGQEGRIIVTTFDNRVMPFIRYDIGDIGALSDSVCPCGRTLRTLAFKGRTVEFIELEDGRVVSLLDIAYSLGSYRDAVRQYQIIQRGKLSFVIKIVPGPLFDANKEYLETLMVRLIHPRAHVLLEITEEIPEAKSGKAVYFVRDFEHTS